MAIVGKTTHRIPMETNAEYSRFRSMGEQGIEEKERKRKERNAIGEKDERMEEDTRKGNRSPHRHKHVSIVGKSAHRMPIQTTAEYKRIRSMGKQGIEEKERKRKERNVIGEKDKRMEEDTRKRNRFPHRAQTRGYSGERNT